MVFQVRVLRIVVIEDLEDSRELIAELLTQHGHEVKTAHDGDSGVALIVAEKPDVALIDIGLPTRSGYDVAREVRQRLCENAPHLIAVTGYAAQTDRELAAKAGFDAHIAKPATARALLAALADVPQ